MRRTLLLMALSLLAGMVWGQSYSYRYWTDNDIGGAVSGSTTGETQFTVDFSGRGNGIHTIHVQARNSAGVWSSVCTRYILLNDEQQLAATTARYWIDNNTSNIHSGVATSGAIDLDLSGLGNGIHAVHYQSVAADGTPSAVRTRYFLLNDGQQQAATTARYWIDNNTSNIHSGVATSGAIDLDLSGLGNGIHAVHYQSVAADGTPSAVRTSYFLLNDGKQQTATKARYWLDNDMTTMHNDVAATGVIDLDLSNLEVGLHAVHFQTMAADGTPSAVRTRYFYFDRVEDCYTASISIDGGEVTDYLVSEEEIVIDISDLESGEHTLRITLTDNRGNDLGTKESTFTVSKAVDQALALTELPQLTYGDDAYELPTKTTEGLSLTWKSGNTSVATISANMLTAVAVGTATITATQAGNENYLPFSREFSLTVKKAPLTIKANNCQKQEGEANPELTVSYEGFKRGDDATVLTKQPTVTTTATVDSPAGTYVIKASGAAADNYVITYVDGTLTVLAKPVVSTIIEFADANVKAICVENWDTNGDGELDTDEAAAVKDLGRFFYKSEVIKSFDELVFFIGLKSIPNYAFQACRNLSSVVLPKSVTAIGSYAFDGCWSLVKAELPEKLTTIDSYAFGGCEKLGSIVIPKGVTDIGVCAFYSCSSMKSLTLQDGLVTIGHNAFEKCVMLTSVVIPSTVEEISNSVFKGCEKLETVHMSENVKTIGLYAFQSCTALKAISLPETIQNIGSYAFDACTKLTTVRAMMEEPVEIGYYTFTNRANATLYVPVGSKTLYQAAEYWKEFKSIIESDEEDLRGDVNGDKYVNGTDLVVLTGMILGQQEENAAADVYIDGLVNGTDYVALVDIILNDGASSARLMAARGTTNKSLMARMGIKPFSITAGKSQTMTLTLDNPNMDVTLVQFDLTLPEGLRLKTDEDGYAVEMTGRTTWKDHTVYIGNQSGESVRVMLASGKNAVIDGNSGVILNVTLVADENYDGGDIVLHNILCTSPDVQECRPYDYTLHLASGSTTGIDGIEEEQMSVIYNISGQRLSAPRKGVNIINGKKVVIK